MRTTNNNRAPLTTAVPRTAMQNAASPAPTITITDRLQASLRTLSFIDDHVAAIESRLALGGPLGAATSDPAPPPIPSLAQSVEMQTLSLESRLKAVSEAL